MEILFSIGLCSRRYSLSTTRGISEVPEAVSLVPPKSWRYWSMA